MVNKITNFSDIAMEISENQYAQTLFMSQLRSNFLVDSLGQDGLKWGWVSNFDFHWDFTGFLVIVETRKVCM